ncbi:Sodium transporter [Nymphaea thermarum]|nr:Sodium transporter [Nymphaea thermarum]
MTDLQNVLLLLHYLNAFLAFFQSYTLHFSAYLMGKIYWLWDLARSPLPWCYRKFEYLLKWSHKAMLFYLNSFWIQLLYFMIISLLGFFVLVILDRNITRIDKPTANLDLFYMSVSATTVSSLVSLNMEDFSVSQLVVLIVLMLLGGEVFTSIISLNLKKIRLRALAAQNEPKICTVTDIESAIQVHSGGNINSDSTTTAVDAAAAARNNDTEPEAFTIEQKKLKCLNHLRHLLLGYFTVVQLCGIALILLYFCLNADARRILERKRINPVLFSVFTTVSSFASCGLIPTNENMMAFKEHSVLLIILIPLVMMGSTMFPPCVNLVVWVIKRAFPRAELNYLLEYAWELRFAHLFPLKNSLFLAASDLGFITVQFILFCFLEWNSEATEGLSAYQKVIGGLFQSVNSRHSGESAFNISLFSPALLVVYIIMMYIPPYTFLSPNKAEGTRGEINGGGKKGKGREALRFWLPPQPAYPILFIVIVCLTEQSSIRRDPLNFSVLNIAFEVMSAYGNVGLSIGYSCQQVLRIVKRDCKDTSASFSGKWSKQGKIVIIIVMFFGRLKKFTAGGGKAWHTL